MLKAFPKAVYVALINGQTQVLGYQIELNDPAKGKQTKNMPHSRVLQKDVLDALNRNGFRLMGTEPFPYFENDLMEPKNIGQMKQILVNELDSARRIAVVQDLTQKYTPNVTDYAKYKVLNPELAVPNAKDVAHEQQRLQAEMEKQEAANPTPSVTATAVATPTQPPAQQATGQATAEDRAAQGYLTRPDRSALLQKIGVKMIETREELDRFYTDFVDGRVDPKTDKRAYLNLNLFVHPSLLHKDVISYVNDRKLYSYLEAKKRVFDLDTIASLIGFFKNDMGITTEIDMFSLNVLYFREEPLEGYDHTLHRTFLEIDKKPVNKAGMVKMVLKKDGVINLVNFQYKHTVLKEEKDFAVIRYDKLEARPKLVVKIRDHKLTVAIDSDGVVSYEFVPEAGELEFSDQRKRTLGRYFDIRSRKDTSVALPLPSPEGLFNGFTEDEYIYYVKLPSKIVKTTSIKYEVSEYDVLSRVGYSFKEIKKLLSIDKSMMDDLLSSIELDFDPDDEEGYEQLTGDDLKLLYAMKQNLITTEQGSAAINADSLLSKNGEVNLLLDAALESKLINPEDAYNEIERVTQTEEPITFNTPVSIHWKVQGRSYYKHLQKYEQKMYQERFNQVPNNITVTKYVTNFSGTEIIGAIFDLVCPKKPALNGRYAESIVMMRQKVEDGNYMPTNGYVTFKRFIPFDPNTQIETVDVTELFKDKTIQFLSSDIEKEESLHKYAFNRFKLAVQKMNESEDGKTFIEPITPYEAKFGISDLRKAELAGVKLPEPEPQVGEVTVVKEDKVVAPVTEQPSISADIDVDDAQPKVEAADVPPWDEAPKTTGVTEVIEPQPEPEILPQPVAEEVKPNVEAHQFAVSSSAAAHSAVVIGTIHYVKDLAEVANEVDKRIVAVILQIQDKNDPEKKFFVKESLSDTYKLVSGAKLDLTGSRIATDAIEVSHQVQHFTILQSLQSAAIKSLPNKPVTESSITEIESRVKESGAATNPSIPLPVLPWAKFSQPQVEQKVEAPVVTVQEEPAPIAKVEEQVAPQPARRPSADEFMPSANMEPDECAVVMYALQESLKRLFNTHKRVDHLYHLIGTTETGIYVKQRNTESNTAFYEEKSAPTLTEDKRRAIGLVKLPNDMYVAETSSGKYMLLDSKLNEVR